MEGLFILLAVIGVTGAIALVTYIIYRYTHPRLKENEKPTEEEILHEEMDRVLQPIDDDSVRKEVEEYKEKDD
ncbi:MAG: hypothetical protein E7175_04445 [Erysipelotrichaceae bacterium]|nr:hypothetical protein [Erysipelotrichaceae bacterium]